MTTHQSLTGPQAADIAEQFQHRRERFPDERTFDALMTVLLNFGDNLTPVACILGEWSGTKGELPRSAGLPLCPNGHPLLETGDGYRLALVPTTHTAPPPVAKIADVEELALADMIERVAPIIERAVQIAAERAAYPVRYATGGTLSPDAFAAMIAEAGAGQIFADAPPAPELHELGQALGELLALYTIRFDEIDYGLSVRCTRCASSISDVFEQPATLAELVGAIDFHEQHEHPEPPQ